MSPRLRFLAAGVLALVVVAAYWVYAARPIWQGTEVFLPVLTKPQSEGRVSLEFPDDRLDPGFPGVTRNAAPGDAVFLPVRAIGNLWDAKADVDRNVQQLRGSIVFVQVQPDGSPIAGGWTAWRPVSVSDGLIAGAVNLRAHVQDVDSSGRLQLHYAALAVRLPRDLAGSRQTVDWKTGPAGPGGVPRAIEPITAAYAILQVLPSGRLAVIGTIIDGNRVPG